LPALRRRRITVTVSPLSIAPLVGLKLSKVKVAPEGTTLTKGTDTSVVMVALLSAELGSGWELETLAVVERVPLMLEVTTVRMVTLAPTAKVPISQERVLPERVLEPWLVKLERTVRPAGID
jgi:hypothetical protein